MSHFSEVINILLAAKFQLCPPSGAQCGHLSLTSRDC